MAMTLLEITNQVNGELGFSQVSSVIGSTNLQTIQMLALLKRLGNDLCRQYEWQRLNKEHIFTTVAYTLTGTTTAGSAVITGISSTSNLSASFAVSGTTVQPNSQIITVDSATQVTMDMNAVTSGTVSLVFSQVQYALPSDWSKQITQTEWDRTDRWPLLGPQSSQEWQNLKSGTIVSGPNTRFRILGNKITVLPAPSTGLTFSFEYVSNYWVRSAADVAKAAYTVDTDTNIFSDSLMVTGLKAQWKIAKGLDASFDLGEFKGLLDQTKGQDKSSPILSLSPYGQSMLITTNNITDGNWNQ